MRYLVEVGGSESPFTYEADTAPKVGDTILNRREGISDAYIVRFFEPSHDDFDGVIKAEWAGQTTRAGSSEA
jgi:hypothetical protein